MSVALTGTPTNATAKVSPTVIYVEPIGVTTEIDAQRFSRTRSAEPVASFPFTGTTAIPTADEVPTALPSTWAALTATVVPDHDQDLSDSGLQRERLLLNLYQRSRFIRIICFLQVVFIVVLGLFFSLFFLLLVFPIAGFYGAKRWNYFLLYIYSVYLILEIIGGIVSMVYIQTVGYIVVRGLFVLLNLVVLRYSLNLVSFIQVLEEEDLEFLKNSPVIINFEKTSLC